MKWRERPKGFTKAMNSLEVSGILLECELLFVLKLAKFFPHPFHRELRKVVWRGGRSLSPLMSLEMKTFHVVNPLYCLTRLPQKYDFVGMVKMKTEMDYIVTG